MRQKANPGVYGPHHQNAAEQSVHAGVLGGHQREEGEQRRRNDEGRCEWSVRRLAGRTARFFLCHPHKNDFYLNFCLHFYSVGGQMSESQPTPRGSGQLLQRRAGGGGGRGVCVLTRSSGGVQTVPRVQRSGSGGDRGELFRSFKGSLLFLFIWCSKRR